MLSRFFHWLLSLFHSYAPPVPTPVPAPPVRDLIAELMQSEAMLWAPTSRYEGEPPDVLKMFQAFDKARKLIYQKLGPFAALNVKMGEFNYYRPKLISGPGQEPRFLDGTQPVQALYLPEFNAIWYSSEEDIFCEALHAIWKRLHPESDAWQVIGHGSNEIAPDGSTDPLCFECWREVELV